MHTNIFFYLLVFLLGCAESSLLCLSFLRLRRAGLFLITVCGLPCGGLSVGAQASGARALIVAAHGLGSCGSGACLLRGMRNLPRPEIESPSPARAGGFVSPGPPGKSSSSSLHSQTICVIHTVTHFAFLT